MTHLAAYGPHYPPPATFNPVDYPCRLLLSDSLDADSNTLILWLDRDPLPFGVDLVEAVRNVTALGGAVLLLARTADVLTRAQAGVRLIVSTPAECWA